MSRAGESRKHAADHTTRYEMLRAYALKRHTPPSREGLVILLRHGMVAWMDAWSRLPAPLPQPAQAEPHKAHTISDDTSVEVVHILATMTLSHFQEVRA
jgi:hypothetical protein